MTGRSIALGTAAMSLAGCGVGAFLQPTPDSLETWSRTPLAPDPGMAQRALDDSTCRAGLDPDVPLAVAIQDRRTASTAAFLLVAPGNFAGCLLSTGGVGGYATNVVPRLSGAVMVAEEGSSTVGSAQAMTLGGLAAPNVRAVRVELADGAIVVASVLNGYWLAWWPGDKTAHAVTALGGDGSIVGRLERRDDGWVGGGSPQ